MDPSPAVMSSAPLLSSSCAAHKRASDITPFFMVNCFTYSQMNVCSSVTYTAGSQPSRHPLPLLGCARKYMEKAALGWTG